jgi:uncharacterized membrane protein YczE
MPRYLKKLLLLPVPLLLSPAGIACYYACGLGADPFSVFVDGEHVMAGWTYGQISLVNNVFIFILMIFWGRRYIGAGTVASVFSTGFFIDLFRELLITHVVAETAPLWLRALVLAFGCVLFACGTGIFIAMDFGVGAVEFLTLFFVGLTKIRLKYVRIALDAFYVLAGMFLGGIVGAGTILGILATGPIIEFTIAKTKTAIDRFTRTHLPEEERTK